MQQMNDDDDDQPDRKKQKVNDEDEGSKKLKDGLCGIWCCSICLDLPKSLVYQCVNGHLMCCSCFYRLLADAKLRGEVTKCPNCKVEISKMKVAQSLVAETIIGLLPTECKYCHQNVSRSALKRHEELECDERLAECKYKRIGCDWNGPFNQLSDHENSCNFPEKPLSEVIDAIEAQDEERKIKKKEFTSYFELLSKENVNFHDLIVRAKTYGHELCFESHGFAQFDCEWLLRVKAIPGTHENQAPLHLSAERYVTHQLILLSRNTPYALNVLYVVSSAGTNNLKISYKLNKCRFTGEDNKGPQFELPLQDLDECNKMIACDAVSFRICMCVIPED